MPTVYAIIISIGIKSSTTMMQMPWKNVALTLLKTGDISDRSLYDLMMIIL
jgi:hypothetical protein